MKGVLLLTIATAIAVLPRDGFAVECRDVLFTQVTNKIETNEILNRAFAKKLNLCDLKSEDDCNTQSWNAGISVVVPKLQIPFGLKGGSAKEQCRSLYAQYCRSEDASEVESRSIRTARSLLDVDVAKVVIAVWQKCVEQTSTELKLFTIRPIPNELGEFILSIRFADQRPDASWPVISKIDPGMRLRADRTASRV